MNCYFYLIFLFVLLGLVSCGESSSEIKSLNPNGDSELALLMRDMYEDGQRVKKEILAGNKPDILKKFKEIHTSEPTEEGKTSSEEYIMYADAYLNSLKLLESADADNIEVSYQAMVQSCINCHKVLCPGPIVRIKKLNLPDYK